MYRIPLACKGVSAHTGPVSACAIAQEFTSRPWQENVKCFFDGSRLILQADNDFDSKRLALADELSDSISACVNDGFSGDIEILSVAWL
jgi:hypothetical protein